MNRPPKLIRFVVNRLRWLNHETAYWLYRLADVFRYKYVGARRLPRHVLCVAMNELGLQKLVRFRDIFDGDDRLAFTVSDSPRGHQARAGIKEWCEGEDVPYLPFAAARKRVWDLVVFADHDAMDRFPVCVPKVRIPHGIGGSKLVDGVPYRHDPHWVEYRGRGFYTRMFEASEYAVRMAVQHNPKLKGVAVAVGDLAADRMLALRPDREDIRTSMGYSESDFVILLQSTYGETSLMESLGRDLISRCVTLAEKTGWRFILQTHPHHWTGPRAAMHPFGQFLLDHEDKPAVTVIRGGEDWAPAMVASDMVITDHTSLSMTYALLEKPMLYVDVPGTILVQREPRQRLAEALPKLSAPENLAADLEYARRHFPRDQVAEIAKDILSYPGESASRIREEVYSLLRLNRVTAEEPLMSTDVRR